MKILLIGYGKMGRTIEKIAVQRGHTIAGKVDLGDTAPLPAADVAIEFTQPGAAPDNLRHCIDAGIPVVCGTTGWLDQKESVDRYCTEKNGTMLCSSNFSLGVNIFFHLNEHLARIMNRYPEYSVSIDETHHTQKKDAPSGTAITLAEGVLRHYPAKQSWSTPEKPGEEDALVIRSFRQDPAPGTHKIRYASVIDDIEIIHTAHSREGFASGALLAAEWLTDKKGVFTMADFLKF